MKKSIFKTAAILLIINAACTVSSSAQVVESREAQLVRGGYDISGTAILEKMADGSVTLRLTNDYSTPSGPDVQIFLASDPEVTVGGYFVEDLGETRNFSGEQSWDLGTAVTIDQYNYIIFRCVAFALHWAGGSFEVNDGGGETGGGSTSYMCETTLAATENWVTEIHICPSDGESDIIPLRNTKDIPAGDHYAYILTDESQNILNLHFEDDYDFEGSGDEPIRVYGVSYDGNLNWTPGNKRSTITADSCYELSDPSIFLTVYKDSCAAASICEVTTVATTNWVTEVSVCPDDGQSDIIPLQNNKFIGAGDRYAYVFTDVNRRIKFLHFENTYNFEGKSNTVDYIYGISYSGDLSYNVGDNISTITSSVCIEFSDPSLFLKVTKDACVAELGSISGKIANFEGTGIAGVDIMLNTGEIKTTNNDGTYTFTDLEVDKAYTVTPRKSGGFTNGVSAQDLVIMARHILGNSTLPNPYLIIAGDANNDRKVSSIDIINLLNLIVGKTAELANNTSWRFVPTSTDLNNTVDIFEFLEKDAVQNLQGDVVGLDFIGIKVGDLSGNASTE